jgi:hypothetical protein
VLEHDRRGTAPDDAEENIVWVWALKRNVKPETVTIKGQRGSETRVGCYGR